MQINPQTTGAPVSSDPTRAADPEHILIQLHRILGSRLFRDSHRLQTFLRYVVTETLEGRAGRIKGFTVAQAVFDRQDPEDAQASTIVRVEASRLRRLLGEYYLGEGRGDPIRIEVPKGGYVPSFEPNPPDASISTSTESEPAGSSRTRFLIGMVAAVSAFAMALMVYLPRHDLAQSTRDPSGFAPTVAPGVPAIAVLPFEDRTTDGRAASVADGLTEDIITDLSRVPGIDVIAFSSVLPFRGQDTDTDQLAQELQVSHVLRGSIRGTPPTLRVTARLLELSTNRELWADRFDRHLSDELSLQGELSQSVVESLTANLLPADRLPTRPAPLAHIEARTLYQQAMNLANPPSDSGRLAVAARAFERVIEMAPDFAGGYAGAAYIGAFRAFWGSSDVSDTDLQKAVSLANRATELDPNFGLAYTALAFAHLSNRDFDAALGASIQAIEAQPGDPYLSPLVSRSQIFEFQPLSETDVLAVLHRAMADTERGLGDLNVAATDEALEFLAEICDGDMRRALNALEVGVRSVAGSDQPFDLAVAQESIQQKAVQYGDDAHYDAASALIKSMRGSDPDAAVYWLARMLEAGKIPGSSRGGSSSLPRKTWATPTHRLSSWRTRPPMPSSSSGCPKAESSSRRRRYTSRPRRNRTQRSRRLTRRVPMSANTEFCRSPSICRTDTLKGRSGSAAAKATNTPTTRPTAGSTRITSASIARITNRSTAASKPRFVNDWKRFATGAQQTSRRSRGSDRLMVA